MSDGIKELCAAFCVFGTFLQSRKYNVPFVNKELLGLNRRWRKICLDVNKVIVVDEINSNRQRVQTFVDIAIVPPAKGHQQPLEKFDVTF